MLRLSWWVYPIIAGVVWLATLLGLLLYWIVDADRVHYVSMDETQYIAYISDVGAAYLKPLFITGCVLTTVLLDISFFADRWLRHKGRLVPNTTMTEKVLAGLTIIFAIIGTAGLILLSIFDTARHPKLHNVFLLFFIAGYVLSAIFICWEYQRLGHHYKDHRSLRISFWIKVFFVVIEILLAIAFIACNFTDHYNPAAVLEWIIAFIFSAYVFSFYVDLIPAVNTKGHRGPMGPRYKGGRGAVISPGVNGNAYPRPMGNGSLGFDNLPLDRGDGQRYVGASEMEEARDSSGSNLTPPGATFLQDDRRRPGSRGGMASNF
ncbi:Frag1/DRAM/Sfk1 family-domain-containing protein [Podospora australis]|uniref:Frag1/DRAM/Sfk1 family-domain-containing protein n=1 Tax=Podospora australis TaxID=1536484 RepID=A0AAN6X7Z8_9PEZI|nr:Frag1/DRAM/Sfk1 family-domain-containing protein [Podospora australis]